ncbi:MAG: type I glyceraldehyde-3-phosphate dehydrogenase [bacterium]|nr:type I glyceraldehyde-3-phosphate dehydrogenase [bacterium]
MTLRVAINGFGRIGRLVLRSMIESKRTDIKVIAINDLAPLDMSAHLLKYDSVHGPFSETAEISGSILKVGSQEIQAFSEADPKQLPWKDLNIDVVMECSGYFASKDKASAHLEAGAKRVLISAPATGADATIVYGVNHKTLKPEHRVVSNASCTTNCLAPVVDILHKNFGLVRGYMTTIHAYTADQTLVDTAHSDPRRARAAALSMIPTSTGAARAVGLVLPELAGKLDGCAIRVPTPNVSMVDLTFESKKKTSVDEINTKLKEASQSTLKGVLDYTDQPLVSADFNHCPASSIFDGTQTHIVEGNFCRVVAWYDNEWGFSNRMSDVALCLGNL